MIRLALLLLSILAVGCQHEPDPAVATKSFFDQLAESHPDAAFRDTAFYFQQAQSSRDFAAIVRDMELDGCALLKAEATTIHGKSAKQSVEVRTRSGATMPLVITLTVDRGAWRVFSVKSPTNIETGISRNWFTRIGRGIELRSDQENPMPDERTTISMARETMLRFHDAIQQKSFEDFYDGVARAWQRQLTLGMLSRTFEGFVNQRTSLIAIKDMEAVLKFPPHIDSEGLLTVAGSYPTQPHRIDFEIKYYYELPNWRPFGVTVRLLE